MSDLAAYGEHYDPATHSWPVGRTPTGPVCTRCKGAGEVVVDDRPLHSTYPNPQWEPAEPTVRECTECLGTGVRPPASFYSERG